MRKRYERGINRSSRLEVLCRKRAPRNPTKPTGKPLHRSLPINSVTGLRPATLLKIETPAQAPSSKPCKIPETPKLQEKQIDIEIYVYIHIHANTYCEEIFICLKSHLNCQYLTNFLYL